MSESPSSIGAAGGAPVPDWLRTLLSILIVGLLVAAPLFLLRSLVAERIQLSQQVQAGAAASWGGAQTIAA